MLKITVDRTRWLRGGNNGVLLDIDTKLMCCLGFVCKTVGLEDVTIEGKAHPQELYYNYLDGIYSDPAPDKDYNAYMRELLEKRLGNEVILLVGKENSDYCARMIVINDDRLIKDSEREAQLIEEGKKANIEFSFIN